MSNLYILTYLEIYFKIQLQINTKCDSIEQDEKREKEGEKSARNRAKT